MKSLAGQEEDILLCEKERGTDGCLYRYRLLTHADGHTRRYVLHVQFSDGDGYRTERKETLPLTADSKAHELFCRLADALVTPIDLPYVLEDLVTV